MIVFPRELHSYECMNEYDEFRVLLSGPVHFPEGVKTGQRLGVVVIVGFEGFAESQCRP